MRSGGRSVTAQDSVDRHFSSVAAGYGRRTAGFPWALVKSWEARAVLTALGPVEGKLVLDLGSGVGFYTRAALKAGARRVVAVDRSAEMLAQLPAGPVTAVQADAAELILDEPVDAIVCAGLLEFVPSSRPVLSRARTFVKPGGTLAVLVPGAGAASRLYRAYHGLHGVEAHLFTARQLRADLERTGWRVVTSFPVFPMATVASAVRPA